MNDPASIFFDGAGNDLSLSLQEYFWFERLNDDESISYENKYTAN